MFNSTYSRSRKKGLDDRKKNKKSGDAALGMSHANRKVKTARIVEFLQTIVKIYF